MMYKTSYYRRSNMKHKYFLASALIASFLIGSGALLTINNKPVKMAEASTETDMDAIALENGEQLDKSNMLYDDFSSGINTSIWAISKKAWGNNTVTNSGVIPENVMYNSTDKTVVFRALGDYYQDNDVNYDLHHTYGYGTSSGNVYSKDGTRTGGCIKTKSAYGPGRYEAKFKIAPVEGVCTAFWTYDYGEHGSSEYNEMDFELPTYLSSSNKDDLYFNRIICTTYYNESKYTSQRVTNPVYLNDDQYHTYCLDWYYSNNTKKVNWFIDGNLIATYSGDNISQWAGRVTLGVWIPGRSNFCGIPNFDKAYMELDYFKYTPFKNQDYYSDPATLDHYVDVYSTITTTPENDFIPHGDFKYGMPDSYVTNGNVVTSTTHNHSGSNSYGVKLAGAGGTGVSYFQYTNPNIRGITKLKLSLAYKAYGSVSVYAGDNEILDSGTLASPSEWATYETNITIPNLEKTLTIRVLSESNDVGFYVDDIHSTFPDESPIPPDPQPATNGDNYAFLTKNNGQTTNSSSEDRQLYPDLNNEHLWQVTACKYATGSSDTIKTLYFKPSTTVMNSSSGSVYYPVKTCLIDNSLFADGDKVAFAGMLFDVDDFSDIDLSFYSYSGVANRYIYILYSLDSGNTYSLLKTQKMNSLTAQSSPFRYNVHVTAPDNLLGETIRFAIVGHQGTGSGIEDAYRLVSVVINNCNNFKTKLDGETCSLDDDSKAWLAYQYDLLTPTELSELSTTKMINYNQSYAAGYSYLLNYWNGSGSGSGSRFIFKYEENAVLMTTLVIGVILMSSFGTFLYIRRKRRINQ